MAELKLDPKKTALVLIDLQNAIVGMNPVPHTAAQVVENSKKLAETFRVHGAPVVYVRVDLNDFMNLPVEQQLKSRGVDTVVLTGISTNAGVESTARQGTGLGFAFVLVEDACSSQNAEHHRFAFENIFPRLTRVRTTDEVLA